VKRDASGRFSVAQLTNTGTLTLPTSTDTLIGRATTDAFTNKTITDPTNTVTASQLRTTGADVVISSAAPPTAGQVLTATSATNATWQGPPKPAVDRQWTSGSGFTSSGTYIDLTSITTHNLGEPGCYTISFNAQNTSSTAGIYYILNVNGVDISGTEFSYGGNQAVIITYVAHNVPAGASIKVRFRSQYQNYQVQVNSIQFMVDGVPESYVR
jgi:hypothetical protein